MTSIREERQRAAARARLEREMAQRAAAARKRRYILTGVGACLALVLFVAAVAVAVVLAGDDEKSTASDSTAPLCIWHPMEQKTATTKDVGIPPTTSPPNSGTQVMTIDTNFGPIDVTMDLSKVPCTAESFRFLSSKQFWDGTKCHRMFPGMLQCGDPSAKGKGYRETDGTGGPGYKFADENLPTNERPPYPAGVMAMANSGPDTNGSQFFFIYQDVQLAPNYTVVGKITSGLDNIKKATAAGHDGAFDPQPGGGHPKNDIEIKTLRVGATQ